MTKKSNANKNAFFIVKIINNRVTYSDLIGKQYFTTAVCKLLKFSCLINYKP